MIGSFLTNDYSYYLNEAFYGKNKKLKKIENQIGIAREKFYTNTRIVEDFYNDKDIEKIGTMFAEYFGFKYCDFNLTNDPAANAYVFPISTGVATGIVSFSDKIKKTKEGLKAGTNMKECSIYIRATTGLWCNNDITDAEVLAVLLHEVGHHFQANRNSALAVFDIVFVCCAWASMISGVGSAYVLYDTHARASLNKFCKESELLSSVVNIFSGLNGFIRSILYNASEVINIIMPIKIISSTIINTAIEIKNNPINVLISPAGKAKEYLSDEFANKLGYGAELASALTKMQVDRGYSLMSKEVYKVKFFRELNDIIGIMCTVITSPIEEHPPVGKRMNAMVKELEKELKSSDLSPQLRKEAEQQIKMIKLVADDLEKVKGQSKSMTSFTRAMMKQDIDPFSRLILNATKETTELSDNDYRKYNRAITEALESLGVSFNRETIIPTSAISSIELL